MKTWGSVSTIALLTACFFVSITTMDRNLADPDLWGHVQFGRDLIRDGLARTTQYTFTAEGYLWINHENLSEVVLAVVYDGLGNVGLIFAKRLLAAVLLGMMVVTTVRRGGSLPLLALALLLIAIPMRTHWVFRPQLASFIGLASLLFCLEGAFCQWKPGKPRLNIRWLIPVPLLMLVWCNSHGGFVAGLAILVSYLGCRSFQTWQWRNRAAEIYRQTIGLLALTAVLSFLMTLINPYGWSLHGWLIQSLGEPRPEIADWHPVRLDLWHGRAFAIAVAISVLVYTVRCPRMDWPKAVVLGLIAWQASQHMRHVALFMIAFGIWVIPEIQFRGRQRMNDDRSLPIRLFDWIVVATSVLVMIGASHRLWKNGKTVAVSNVQYPVNAFQFIHQQNLSGRMVVTYNWAQYVIGAFGDHKAQPPICDVSFDGRFRTCYPQSIVDMNLDFQLGDLDSSKRNRNSRSGPFDPVKVLTFKDPNLVLLDRRQRHPVLVMENQTDDWVLLYQDAIAQVWGKRNVFDSLECPRYVFPNDRLVSEKMIVSETAWPAFPNR